MAKNTVIQLDGVPESYFLQAPLVVRDKTTKNIFLRGGLFNVLVTDEKTARIVLEVHKYK